MSGIDLQGETEMNLVAGLRQGCQQTLGKLYDAYAPVLMGSVTRIVQDEEVAEQVLHQTFVSIWSRIDSYDAADGRLLTWVLSISRELALEAVKAKHQADTGSSLREFPQAQSHQNEPMNLKNGEVKLSDRCMLNPLERYVLELLYIRGRSCAEVAGEMDLAEEELNAVLKRAFTQLKAGKSA